MKKKSLFNEIIIGLTTNEHFDIAFDLILLQSESLQMRHLDYKRIPRVVVVEETIPANSWEESAENVTDIPSEGEEPKPSQESQDSVAEPSEQSEELIVSEQHI